MRTRKSSLSQSLKRKAAFSLESSKSGARSTIAKQVRFPLSHLEGLSAATPSAPFIRTMRRHGNEDENSEPKDSALHKIAAQKYITKQHHAPITKQVGSNSQFSRIVKMKTVSENSFFASENCLDRRCCIEEKRCVRNTREF